MLYRHELLLQCVPQIFEHEYTSNKCLIIPSGNCTPGRLEQLRLVLSRHSLGFLLSVLCLAAFAWASCCFLFIITSGMSESRFHNPPQYYHYILLSVPFLSLWDSLLWNLSLGVFLRFLHFPNFKGTLFYNPYLHFHYSLDELWTRRVRVRICPYQSIRTYTCTCTVLWMNMPWQRPHTPV